MTAHRTQKKYPLVGVGASAGGIDSFQKFLKAVPANSGMAYILVQHLSPSHDSLLTEILAKATSLPVREITDDCDIEPDHVYVIPENKMLEVTDHSLQLTPREKGAANMPIDHFFSSLARVHGTFAIGVVLSGTARDGTAGLGDIKEHGGITFAEDPRYAAWEGMPKNAIEAGVVDFVLPVEEIPGKMVNVNALYGTEVPGVGELKSRPDENGLKKILSTIRQHSGVDFGYYKRPTLLRRIHRRMAIQQIADHKDYLELLRSDRGERQSLFQDLLIRVTSFFRDPEVFGELRKSVFPKILEEGESDAPIRIWVPGCASGEEAYSLAIALFDTMGGLANGHNMYRKKIQIFASDISESALAKARSGIYGPNDLKPLTPEARQHYFEKTDGSYRVVKPIRDTIVFAVHNFLKDPPFGKLDLISCRNVFIYLDPFLQRKALSTFHYALRESAFLLLGKSEDIGTPSDLFEQVSKQGKIFWRKPGSGRLPQLSPRPRNDVEMPPEKPVPSFRRAHRDFRKDAEAVLISRYTPASVIVDGHMEVVHINGSVVPFLEPSTGKPTHELMKMAHRELAFELRNALHKARESQETVIKEGIPVNHDGERFSATIEVVPLTDGPDAHYLVLFRKRSPNTSFLERVWKKLRPALAPSEKNGKDRRIGALERELEQAREDMRAIGEEHEANSEELQSANEELRSGNEELQSVNEELETSKEELQSTNEELIVVNRELLEKQDQQNKTLAYLDAVIANLREPFLVLGKEFSILSANASYYKRFDTDQAETEGRDFFEIQDGIWNHPDLRDLLQKILPKNQHIVDEEIIVRSPSGESRSFMFNAREIVREEKYGKSILLSIEDITERKMTEGYKNTIEELKKANEKLDRYVHVASHDLQEPLRKIMVFSDRLLEKGALPDPGDSGTLRKVASSAERMAGLIRGLLDYSRLSHDGERFESTDLNEVLKNIRSDFELLIKEKGAKLKIEQLPVVETIPLQMNQLFYNLIGNALKFSKEGVAPIVEISARRLSDGEVKERPLLNARPAYFEITVSDNGIGFNPKYHERIFIIFQRLHGAGKHKGSGIGLSLVKKIVENHHGEISAVSEENNGAAFHIILPAVQPDRE